VARLGDSPPAQSKVEPASLARLVAMVSEKAVSASAAKEVLGVMAAEGGEPEAIVESQGLARAGEDELAGIVERAIAEQADAVEKVRQGNEKAIGAIMGAVMRETKGRADGAEVQRMIRERIGA
jgi:aspartyl-tRNA(Asn)/glutamyl-tRNA(Gln) amidotransferase subunit B